MKTLLLPFSLPLPVPTDSFLFSNLLFKENFSERQHCLGNCFLGSRNDGNGVSEYSILKISRGSMPPDPLGACAFGAREAPQRKHSRPVLSEVCPLLYKTVENPEKINE